jgi:hypothetical protein
MVSNISLAIRKQHECKELCRKRIQIEKALDVAEIDYNKCIKMCMSNAIK